MVFIISLLITFTSADSLPNPQVIIPTSLHIGGDTSFVTLNGKFRSANEPYDGVSPFTTTPMYWTKGSSIAGLRIRHPLSVTGNKPANPSTLKDFMILPYQYGMAIEYNGVVECWVGEWSIHRGLHYGDVEGNKDGWGAVLWVGDDNDLGGLRATSRDNTSTGGNVNYSEISSEKFAGGNHGDLRFRLPDTTNTFQFVYGKRGSNDVISEIGAKGFVLPNGNLPVNPKPGTIIFDTTDNKFKGFDGTSWKILSE